MLVSKYIMRSVRKKYGETQYQVIKGENSRNHDFPQNSRQT
jgi:hypothetical protein